MKKRFLALLLTVLTVCNLLIPSAVAEEPASTSGPQSVMKTYYVSPGGSDSNDGTSSSTPFKTLEKARDTVRSVNKSMTGDIVVYLMDGTWELESTLTFGKEDSGANGHNIWYKAYNDAKPMLSGGTKLTGNWEAVTVNNNVSAYKTTLDRNVKLRALYVNGQRRYMAHTENPVYSFWGWPDSYQVEKDSEDWAWANGNRMNSFWYYKKDVPEITKNVQDVEIENQFIWNKNTVCVEKIEPGTGQGDKADWGFYLQQPYGAIAQTPGWNVNFGTHSPHVLHNAYEFLDQPGEFYFDRAEKTLYYIPMAGEDMSKTEVVVPRLETVVEFRGTPTVTGEMKKVGADNKTITGQVKNVIFDGISVAHSDWNLQKVGDSYGKSTVQAGTVYTAYASGNWHADMYRNLDILPGAVEMEFAHNVIFRNGEVKLTGGEGVVLSNDVDGCQVIGNFIYQTGGGGVLVGHPQHIYENDSLEPETYYYHHQYGDGKPEVSADGAGAEHEKYQNGTERAPRDVKVSNNFLLENCRLFPSHCPITSYYTQRLEVSNNFIKDAAYSGMSIGWGWGNFDGETNGDRWGTENDQGYAIIPNIPTNVCRDNKIINNRIDRTMTILDDGGLIYTLGKQDGTLIAGNYGRDSLQGLYQDEGSANFETIRDNVMADVRSYALTAMPYGRKHDLHYDNNYSNKNTEIYAPQYNVTGENFHYIPDSIWPKAASDIIQNSGLTAEYRARFSDLLAAEYGSLQDALMPASASLKSNEALTLNAWLDASDEIWLAPADTTDFTEGSTMTKAAGNAAEIPLPKAGGDYRLFVKTGDTFSAASKAVVRVESVEAALTASPVAGTYSEAQQVTLSVPATNAKLYYTADGTEPSDSSALCTGPISIAQTTTLKVAVYLDGVKLGTDTLQYYIVDLTKPIPDGALLHLDATTITANNGDAVSAWASGEKSLTQSNPSCQPKLVKEDGISYLQFDGNDDYLTTDSFDNLNGKNKLTVIMVSRQDEDKVPNDINGDTSPVLSMPETAGWGGICFNPKVNSVLARFGVGSKGGNGITTYQRPSAETEFSAMIAVKDGTTDTIYANGAQVHQAANRGETIANTDTTTLYLAKGKSTGTYFEGGIAEVLIYDRALTEAEIRTISLYFQNKYLNAAAPTASPAAGSYNAAQTVTLTSATRGAEIYYTLDGTDPTTDSTKYTQPLEISKTTTVKAIAAKDGWNSSNVAEFTYALPGDIGVTGIEVLKDGTAINDGTIKVYTNAGDPGHSVTLTTRVTPENATDKTLNITRPEGAQGMITLERHLEDGTATIIAIPGAMNVGEVTIEVVSASNSEVKATFKVQVIRKLENPVSISIQGVNDPNAAPKFGQTLVADINQLVMTDAGKAALRYQWKRNGTAISGATGKTYTLTKEGIGATISVDVTADEDTFYEGTQSATRSQKVIKADGPTISSSTIYGVKGTEAGNDGQITGFGTDFAKYEYKAKDAGDWTAVKAAEVTGLASGEYQVRIKATDTHEAGAEINVTVPAYNQDFKKVNIASTLENGTITRDHPQAAPGTTITLTVNPATGYELETITVTGTSGAVTLSGDGNTRTFAMPDEDVTVDATFKKIKLTITHKLTNLTCSRSPAGDRHEVEYGDTAAIKLVPDEGYRLPDGADIVIVNGNGGKITGWTIDQGGTITITGGVTSDLTITAAGVRQTCTVNFTVTNGVTAEGAPRSVEYGAAYSATLRVTSGYSLPKSVTMTLDGAAFTDFTYDSATGTISIAAGKLTGKLLVITASGSTSGGSSSGGNSGGSSKPSQPSTPMETEKPAPSGSTEVKAPTANVDEKGEAQISVSTSQMSGAITEAAKENKAEIVVEAKVDGDATKVSVEVTKASVGQMANQTEAALTVKTDIADVKIPASSLEDLSKKSGGTITVSAEIAEDAVKIEVKIDDTPVTKLSGGVVAKVPAQTAQTGNVLVVVNADGTETVVKKSIVDGQTVAGLVDGSCTVKIIENNKTFADTANHWAKDAVEFAASRELFQGTSASTFSPSAPMNRAMLATVLYRLEDAAASGSHGFADVPSGTWYTDAVTWASQSGIVSGTGNGFNPNGNVTREQLATMLYRYAKTLGMDTAARGSLTGFADNGRTSGWAEDAMTWAVDNGLITGKGNSRLDPTGTATRAEVAAIMQRMVGLMVK